MPLEESRSDEAVGRNIKRLQGEGKPHKQAIAIALDVQRRAKNPDTSVGGMFTYVDHNPKRMEGE